MRLLFNHSLADLEKNLMTNCISKSMGEFLTLCKELTPFFRGEKRLLTLSKLLRFAIDMCSYDQACLEAHLTVEVLLKEHDLILEPSCQQILLEKLPSLMIVLDSPSLDTKTVTACFKMLLSLIEILSLQTVLNKIYAVCFNNFICQLHTYTLVRVFI